MRDLDTPPHIPRRPFRSALVGPLVRFRGQQVPVTSSPPQNTCDPRYAACTDHHLACDCREAERSEDLHEYRSALREIGEALAAATEGHATWVYVRGERRTDLECRCTGCVIARVVPPGTVSGRWESTKRVEL